MLDAYIYEGLRTPFGRHAGKLAPVRPDDLLAGVMKELVARGKFPVESIEDVLIGCTNQAGEDSRNVARNAAARCRIARHQSRGKRSIASAPADWAPCWTPRAPSPRAKANSISPAAWRA